MGEYVMNLNLAHVRNMLFRNRFEHEEQSMLEAVLEFSFKNNSPFYSLIKLCVENCLHDININDFKSAAQEIHFIHNFPLSIQNVSDWDEYHFYSIEMLSYFDLTEKYDRIKSYIFEIAISQKNIYESGISPKNSINDNIVHR